MPKYITRYEYPPIPDRRWDWSAVTDEYDGTGPVGEGATEREALLDLLDQLEEKAEAQKEIILLDIGGG